MSFDTFIDSTCPSEDDGRWKSLDHLYHPDGAVVLKILDSGYLYEDKYEMLVEGVNPDPKYRHFINVNVRVYHKNSKGGWDITYEEIIIDDQNRYYSRNETIKFKDNGIISEELERLRSTV
jgi:hypothetical protein